MTIDVRPGPSWNDSVWRRSPSSISYGKRDELGRVVVDGDEHRLGVEQRPQALADELDDGLELELAAEGQADLVDEGQLGVALAGLLDRADPAQGGADVLPDERQQVPVGFRVEALPVVRLDDDDPEGLALGDQRGADPVAADGRDADSLDLAPGDEVRMTRGVQQQRPAGPQQVAGGAGRLADADRIPGGRVREVGVDRVDVVREVDRLALGVVQRDVEVLDIHESADDAVDGGVERRQVLRRAGRVGDAQERVLHALGLVALGVAGLELGEACAQGGDVLGHRERP